MVTYEIVPGDGEELDREIARLYPTHTYKEIADELGINPSRVKNRVKILSIYSEIQNKCPHRTKRAIRKMRFHDIVEKDDATNHSKEIGPSKQDHALDQEGSGQGEIQ